ncbi:hypothetical protein [Parvularcula sp. LCG005]|uniref:hypothetical protein n=1 Tax=Parvularcula sp. LCG005 TaxID=3078805 RepID=UPI002943DFAC|nr:hypothetical protein [Parvularcula sp. LCG005]WOI54306.1 hypothetical protein RUI03_04720 [Parvularcula sp. LCG005]
MADINFPNIKGLTLQTPPQYAPSAFYGGQIAPMQDCVVVPDETAVADRLCLGLINSSAYLLPQSKIYVEAMGTGVTMDFGGTNDEDGILDGVDVSAADEFELGAAVMGVPIWQLLGYTEDPLTDLELFFTIRSAAVSADAKVTVSLLLVDR